MPVCEASASPYIYIYICASGEFSFPYSRVLPARAHAKMVVPTFGFSVGDFVAVTKLLITLFDSFKESGGAATKYTSEKAFLASLTSTVLRLSHYVQNTPHDEIAREILSLLEIITEPLKAFRAFLNKHAGALEKLGTASGFSKTRLTMSFTMKEISGKVEKLRREIEQPIHAVNSLLALQVLYVHCSSQSLT